jgi:hypothetical protein
MPSTTPTVMLMNATQVHLEDVTRAARQGLVLALTASLLALVAMLIVGIPLAIALLGAAMLFVLGSASGGFGLVARIALRGSRPQSRPAAGSGSTVPPLRVPQTR